MLGIDRNLVQNEERILKRKVAKEIRAMKAQSAMTAYSEIALTDEFSSADSSHSSDSDATSSELVAGPSTTKNQCLRGTKELVTP